MNERRNHLKLMCLALAAAAFLPTAMAAARDRDERGGLNRRPVAATQFRRDRDDRRDYDRRDHDRRDYDRRDFGRRDYDRRDHVRREYVRPAPTVRRVWVPGHYETRTVRVWVPGRYVTETVHVRSSGISIGGINISGLFNW